VGEAWLRERDAICRAEYQRRGRGMFWQVRGEFGFRHAYLTVAELEKHLPDQPELLVAARLMVAAYDPTCQVALACAFINDRGARVLLDIFYHTSAEGKGNDDD
jgi:hypothetical protein